MQELWPKSIVEGALYQTIRPAIMPGQTPSLIQAAVNVQLLKEILFGRTA
jgi:hypothetical protein